MTARFARWRLAGLALLTALLLCALALPALLLYTRPTDHMVLALIDANAEPGGEGTENWSFYRMQAGAPVPLTHDGLSGYDGLAYDGETFYYSRILEQKLDSPVLHIDTANRSVAVFLDGDLLYTDFPQLDNRIGFLELPMQEEDRAWPVLVSLPTDFQGRTLTIAQSTSPMGGEILDRNTVYPCGVTLYCGFAYESGLIAAATGTAMWMALLFFLAAALLLLLVYQASQNCADWGILFLAALLLVRMVGVMASSDFCLQYLPWMTVPDLNFLSWHLSATTMACFLAIHMDRLPKLCLSAAAVLQALLAFADCWVQLQGGYLWLPTTVSALLLMAALCLSVVHWRRGRPFFVRLCRSALCLSVLFAAGLAVLLLLRPEHWSSLVFALWSVMPDNAVLPLRLLNLLCMASCVTVTALEFLHAQAERGAQQAALVLRAQMAQDSYLSIRRQAEEVAMVRHDLQKHLAVASTLLSDHQTDKTIEYLTQVSREITNIRPVVNTGNYLLDILLNSKLSQLRDQGVRLEVRCAAGPDSLALSDTDLSALLLNALDNTAHAVTDPMLSDPWVVLTLCIRGRHFYFACENAMLPDGARVKKSAASSEHGYGMIIMRRIVEKCDGIMEISRLSDRFKLMLVLPLGDPPNPNS